MGNRVIDAGFAEVTAEGILSVTIAYLFYFQTVTANPPPGLVPGIPDIGERKKCHD